MRKTYVEIYRNRLLLIQHDLSELKSDRVKYPFPTIRRYESPHTNTPAPYGLVDFFHDEELIENYHALSSLLSDECYVIGDWSQVGPRIRESNLRGPRVTELYHGLRSFLGEGSLYQAEEFLDAMGLPFVVREHGQNSALCFAKHSPILEGFSGNASHGSPLMKALEACTEQVLKHNDVDVFKGTIHAPLPEIFHHAPISIISEAIDNETLNLPHPSITLRVSDAKSNSSDSVLVKKLKARLDNELEYLKWTHDDLDHASFPILRENERVQLSPGVGQAYLFPRKKISDKRAPLNVQAVGVEMLLARLARGQTFSVLPVSSEAACIKCGSFCSTVRATLIEAKPSSSITVFVPPNSNNENLGLAWFIIGQIADSLAGMPDDAKPFTSFSSDLHYNSAVSRQVKVKVPYVEINDSSSVEVFEDEPMYEDEQEPWLPAHQKKGRARTTETACVAILCRGRLYGDFFSIPLGALLNAPPFSEPWVEDVSRHASDTFTRKPALVRLAFPLMPALFVNSLKTRLDTTPEKRRKLCDAFASVAALWQRRLVLENLKTDRAISLEVSKARDKYLFQVEYMRDVSHCQGEEQCAELWPEAAANKMCEFIEAALTNEYSSPSYFEQLELDFKKEEEIQNSSSNIILIPMHHVTERMFQALDEISVSLTSFADSLVPNTAKTDSNLIR